VARGYRYTEVDLPKPEIKEDVKFQKFRESDPGKRPAVQVSLGCHLVGAACPHPDPADVDTMIAGACKRFASETPTIDRSKLKRLRDYVDMYYTNHLSPLDPNADTSVEAWLAKTNYPQWRKDELLAAWKSCPNPFDKKYWTVKSFGKDETYVAYKHERGINARSDVFKCLVGPIFHLIEEQVYKLPQFIKHVPVAERANYIYDRLYSPGAFYGQSDFETFEALFVKDIMCNVEIPMYKYMTAALPEANWFAKICDEVLAGENDCRYRDFRVILNAVRMSGEMCTSLGNGWSNLMFNGFVAQEKGCHYFDGVVEGDDGLFRFEGAVPTTRDYTEIGLKIKLEIVDDISHASFCGIVFAPEDRNNLADPWKVMANFGWTSQRYERCRPGVLKALLRAKALSLAHAYPGAPVIQALAHFGLRATSDVKRMRVLKAVNRRGAMSAWMRDWVVDALNRGEPAKRSVGIASRLVVEEVFGMPVSQQLSIERYLDGISEIRPMNIPLDGVPDSWLDYWSVYVDGQARQPPHRTKWVLSDVLVPVEGGWLVPKKRVRTPVRGEKRVG